MNMDMHPHDVKIDLGMNDKERTEVVLHLKKTLSDEYVLFTKLFKFHWNVQGPFFGPLHSLFQTLYEQNFKTVDLVAERIRALGHMAPGTLKEFLDLTHLKEASGTNPESCFMLQEIFNDLQTIVKHLRDDEKKIEKLNDRVTSNMLLGIIEQHEKSAWMVRAHLEKVEGAKK